MEMEGPLGRELLQAVKQVHSDKEDKEVIGKLLQAVAAVVVTMAAAAVVMTVVVPERMAAAAAAAVHLLCQLEELVQQVTAVMVM